MSDVEGEADDLAEYGGEGEQEGGEAVLFAVDGKKVAAEQDERHENQGEQGGQQQVGFAFVHGVLWEEAGRSLYSKTVGRQERAGFLPDCILRPSENFSDGLK